jgi:hypothetical protein
MARKNGRDLRFVDASGNVAGVATTKSFTVNNTPVDVTGDTDNAFITVLSRPATKQITAELTFVFDDAGALDVRNIALVGTGLLAEYTIEFLDDGDAVSPTAEYSITGDFYLSSVSITGASDGRVEGTASWASSGAWEVSTA